MHNQNMAAGIRERQPMLCKQDDYATTMAIHGSLTPRSSQLQLFLQTEDSPAVPEQTKVETVNEYDPKIQELILNQKKKRFI
ncbi:hypothetical protein Tco_0651462 [Tanacetum coccineum]|uniref:Uncharacterized protein n=1 Tax=Tanacetum coccineum TaxID=301880 RepID=A0ABQ4WV62_9ASTR